MPDYSTDSAFRAAVAAAEAGISYLAGERVADAMALVDRLHGRNNLQGHYNAVVPLAVLVLRKSPWLSGLISFRHLACHEHD